MSRSRKKLIFYLVVLCIFAKISFTFAHEEAEQEVNSFYKISGQIKARGDFSENQSLGDFSFSPDTDDEQIIARVRAGVSLKPISQLEVFAQGQYYERQNHNDYTKTNLYQLYLDFFNTEHSPFSLKVGRQELVYGSAFFLGANDFYEGLVWDGTKIKLSLLGNFWIDLIAGRYVQLNRNVSANEPALYGTYSSYNFREDLSLDSYLFYHKGGFKFFHTDLEDSPNWYTFGIRFSDKVKQLDFEIEPLYQFGEINNSGRGDKDAISAFGGHFEAGYTIDSLEYKPRLFAGYAFGSGDNDTSDKKYGEFHGNVYNDNYIVGDSSIVPDLSGLTVGSIRASGINIFLVGVCLDINPKLNINLDNHYFWADKTPNDVSKNIGDEINFVLTYKILDNLNIIASANRFFTGKFFEDASGSNKDINYFYVQTQFKF